MPYEIRTLKNFLAEASEEELARRLSELKQELFNLRSQAAMGGLENPKRIWFVRKAIARVNQARARRAAGGSA